MFLRRLAEKEGRCSQELETIPRRLDQHPKEQIQETIWRYCQGYVKSDKCALGWDQQIEGSLEEPEELDCFFEAKLINDDGWPSGWGDYYQE